MSALREPRSVGANQSLSRFAGTQDRPVFIGGCPRSGTTLLRSMLNSHPELAIPRETRFLLESWRRRDRFGDLSVRRNRRRLAKWIFSRKAARPARLETDPGEGIDRLVAAPPTLGSLLGASFALYAERFEKVRWGDKRPMLCQYLDAIFALFPDAQFIHLVRDPRGATASMRKIDWYGRDIAPATELWERSIRAVDQWRGRLAPDQLIEIQYESLVSDPAAVMGQLCERLDLDPSGIDAMLTHVEGADLPTSRIHWQVAQPVSTASVRSWEQTLAPDEVSWIERTTGKAMRRYGYEFTTDSRGAGTGPHAGLQRTFEQRRQHHDKKRRQRKVQDLKLKVTYRKPVQARLTTGQRSLTR